MQYDEFADCAAWWNDRTENECAWKVWAEDIVKYSPANVLQSVNLDIKNPNDMAALEHRSPEELVESIAQNEHRIIEIMDEIRQMVRGRIG